MHYCSACKEMVCSPLSVKYGGCKSNIALINIKRFSFLFICNISALAWAVLQLVNTSRQTKTTLTCCYALLCYLGTILAMVRSLSNRIHSPEMEKRPLKTVCGYPCGGAVIRETDRRTDRQTETERQGETEIERRRHRHRETDRYTERHRET